MFRFQCTHDMEEQGLTDLEYFVFLLKTNFDDSTFIIHFFMEKYQFSLPIFSLPVERNMSEILHLLTYVCTTVDISNFAV